MVTLRQQIGQMLIIGFAGTQIEEHSAIAKWLSNDGLGGVLLFDYDLIKKVQGKNLVDQQQIKELSRQIHHYSQAQSLTPFIAIDYEGGAVDRLKHIAGCMKTRNPCELAQLSDDELRAEVGEMAKTLKALGFNLNFAPVVDLNLNEKQGIIGKLGRSFSSEPSEVARAAKIFIEVLAAHGLVGCYKHFPGHGSAIGDTHEGFVDVTGSFQSKELEPYSLLLANAELPAMIMTAHVINRQLDASGLPATLSYPILTGLLRQELRFDGVIISDDLQMQAIASHYSIDEALALTINAGADMVIFANQLGEIGATEVIDRIEALVQAKRIDKSRIEQAYARVVSLKKSTKSSNLSS